jgi:hypothetical protein
MEMSERSCSVVKATRSNLNLPWIIPLFDSWKLMRNKLYTEHINKTNVFCIFISFHRDGCCHLGFGSPRPSLRFLLCWLQDICCSSILCYCKNVHAHCIISIMLLHSSFFRNFIQSPHARKYVRKYVKCKD